MSIRILTIAAVLAVAGLGVAACQPATDGKEEASTEGAMAPSGEAMAPASDAAMAPSADKMAPAADGAMAGDKMAPAATDGMAPAQDKMAPAQ